MAEPRMPALSDEQVDRLIGRLEARDFPVDPFASRLLAVLEPRVRDARRRDRSRIGRWLSASSATVARLARPTGASPRVWQLAAIIGLLLLAGILAFVGAQHHRVPASQLGFHPTPQPLIEDISNGSLATLLQDGRVLVIRGTNVDVFNPRSGTYASLIHAVRGGSQVLGAIRTVSPLPDGRLLLTDGGVFILDPRSGAVETGPALPTGSRPATLGQNYTATQLLDGRELFAGGDLLTTSALPPFTHNEQTFAAAVLFDPGTLSFAPTGAMTVARYGHTATLLRDGRVLFAGGVSADGNGTQVLAAAEIYDPRTGLFSPTAPMPEPRSDATAALLQDGRVLVVGGGLDDPTAPSATAVLYDPATGTWVRTGSLHTERFAPSSVVLPDGRVLVMGGLTGLGATTADPEGNPDTSRDVEAELYDPDAGTFGLTAPATMAHPDASLVLLPDGDVFVTSRQYSIRTGAGPDELFGPLP
jgi:hypothetical protein